MCFREFCPNAVKHESEAEGQRAHKSELVKQQPAEEHGVTACANIIVKGRWQHGGTVVTLEQHG